MGFINRFDSDIFADIFGCEDALVRGQFISGSHALCVCLFGLLRPNDILLSICGKPYDTLDEVIGIVPNDSSLMSFGVKYNQIELVNDDFDFITLFLSRHRPTHENKSRITVTLFSGFLKSWTGVIQFLKKKILIDSIRGKRTLISI